MMKDKTKIWIFGYGSIMNPSSAIKTLKRDIGKDDIFIAELCNHFRKWKVTIPIQFKSEPGITRSAVFLDLERKENLSCFGVLLRVTQDELESFDIREKNYARVEVTKDIKTDMEGHVYTYIGQEPYTYLQKDTFILKEYQNIIEGAFTHWGEEFKKQYFKTTEEPSLPLIEGEYSFLSAEQNRQTGR